MAQMLLPQCVRAHNFKHGDMETQTVASVGSNYQDVSKCQSLTKPTRELMWYGDKIKRKVGKQNARKSDSGLGGRDQSAG